MKAPDWKSLRPLGFGRIFYPEILVRNWSQGQEWSKPTWINPDTHLNASAAVVQYGQSVFEGLKAYRGNNGEARIFRPEFHATRFRKSAERVCLPAFPDSLFLADIMELVKRTKDWIPDAAGESLYLRPTLLGTEAFLGVRPSHEAKSMFIASPVGNYYEKGVNPLRILIETDDVRAAPGGLGEAKTGANYASSLRAGERAKALGFDQVLWLDAVERQWIEEVGTMNIFFVIGDKVITPVLNGSILHGCTRDTVLQLLREWKIPVEEKPFSVAMLAEAAKNGSLKEVFGTGTAAVISPVGELQSKDKQINISVKSDFPIAYKLRNEIMGFQSGAIADRHKWVTVV